jgi:hypothetical protein
LSSYVDKSSFFFFWVQRGKKTKKKFKGNYPVKQIPQASASRARFNSAGGMTIEEKTSV